MNVKITRRTSHYRRTVNGAWIGNGNTSEMFTVLEEQALAYVMGGGLSASCVVEWPDGHVESFGHGTGLDLFGPGDSRLIPEGHRGPACSTWWPASGRIYGANGFEGRWKG